jgi:hypothetical protein
MIVEEGHPIYRLRSQLLLDKPDLVLEFSRYVYLEYGKTLSRETFQMTASNLTDEWFAENLSLLDNQQELAFHSRVIDGDKIYHLPMIDFVNTTSDHEVNSLMTDVNKMFSTELWLCHSGQSLHGYYFELIENERWLDYLAKLLLCNQSENNRRDIVDQRWVAHSLEHRFSALRWSHNTNRYLSMPTDYAARLLSGRLF